jgi:D-arabinose 1-dehydrogenase-like Zn-dependent alcohol dehydrogenase
MKAVVVPAAGSDLALVQRDVPEPGPNAVRVRIDACGICHTDKFVKEGGFPGLAYPRIPGHEIAGVVEAIGAGGTAWRTGDRVGIGWYGDHCGKCDSCRRGDYLVCDRGAVIGVTIDGGYAEYVVAPVESLARLPDELSAAEAAPIMCAGVTMFNALRNCSAHPGDLVAVQGIGGLGHLGIQYADKMGFETVAISSGAEKREVAAQLGARVYIDSTRSDPGSQLRKLGGARVILVTAPDAKAIGPLLGGLTTGGKLILLAGIVDPIGVPAIQLIQKRLSIIGWPSGTSKDSEDALRFAVLKGIRPIIERIPFDRLGDAYSRTISGRARFRSVVEIGS